jgi:hypothetical protein
MATDRSFSKYFECPQFKKVKFLYVSICLIPLPYRKARGLEICFCNLFYLDTALHDVTILVRVGKQLVRRLLTLILPNALQCKLKEQKKETK